MYSGKIKILKKHVGRFEGYGIGNQTYTVVPDYVHKTYEVFLMKRVGDYFLKDTFTQAEMQTFYRDGFIEVVDKTILK